MSEGLETQKRPEALRRHPPPITHYSQPVYFFPFFTVELSGAAADFSVNAMF